MIDCGPDFRQQMLRASVDWIDAILITHEHNDHIIGIDDIRPLNFKYKKDIMIYAVDRVHGVLKQRFEYIFAREYDYPGAPKAKLNTINDHTVFEIGEISVIPIQVIHGSLPILGFRIDDFAYLTDVKTIPENQWDKLKNLKTLVINALHQNKHYTHLNLQEALDIISILKPDQAYLTHISHRMGKHAEINQILPSNVALAYDGLTIDIH